MENQNFIPGTKVSLHNDFGVVLNKMNANKLFGFIRWDTKKEMDIENWCGLYGSFLDIGGKIVEQDYKFKYINDDGTIKESDS